MARAFEIVVTNRQRTKRLDRKFIEELSGAILSELKAEKVELGLHFVGRNEMARVHEQFMNIAGSTDVITFDHGSKPPMSVHGELFISVEDAIAQAREFGTTWQSEVARYMIHGVLHLLGFDDLEPVARARMKRAENRALKKLGAKVNLRSLEKTK